MSTLSPNMSLPISAAGVDTGLTWETNLNASQMILDGHNHSSGSGVQINPSGLDISSDLPFGGNSATQLKASIYLPQSSFSSLNAVYTIGPDLYYNDGNGVVIPITKTGSLAITGSSISSGSATASFSAGVLVVNSASLTPGNIQAGSILIGNNVANSKFVTLSAPNSLGANYSIVLPSLPGSTSPVTIDSSGNMGTTTNDAIGQGMTSVGANAIAASRTRSTGSTVGAGGVASSNIASYTNSTTSLTNVTSVTITTSGRPVVVQLVPLNSGVTGAISISSAGSADLAGSFRIQSGATNLGSLVLGQTTTSAVLTNLVYSASSIGFLDFPAAGTYTYTLQAGVNLSATGSPTVSITNVSLIAYEL